MKNNVKYLVAVGCMAAALLTGCSGEKADQNGQAPGGTERGYNTESGAGQESEENGADNNNASVDFEDSSQLFETANLNGKVTDFTDSGFSASLIVEDGDTAQIAVGGEDAGDMAVTVQYTENTVFQRASVNTATESISGLTDADRSEIKKESQVLVYGTYDEAGVLEADKVIRLVWE